MIIFPYDKIFKHSNNSFSIIDKLKAIQPKYSEIYNLGCKRFGSHVRVPTLLHSSVHKPKSIIDMLRGKLL